VNYSKKSERDLRRLKFASDTLMKNAKTNPSGISAAKPSKRELPDLRIGAIMLNCRAFFKAKNERRTRDKQ